MVPEGVPLDPAVENGRIVPSPRLAAEVEHLVVPGMLRLEEPRHFTPRISVQVFHAGGWKTMANYPVSNVDQIEGEALLLEPVLLLGN